VGVRVAVLEERALVLSSSSRFFRCARCSRSSCLTMEDFLGTFGISLDSSDKMGARGFAVSVVVVLTVALAVVLVVRLVVVSLGFGVVLEVTFVGLSVPTVGAFSDSVLVGGVPPERLVNGHVIGTP